MSNTSKINLFISYSHDDDAYFKVFSEGLKKATKKTLPFIWNVWDDTKIHIGTFWDDEIQNNIKGCNVAMLLVSVGFMASEYIKEKEFEEFKKRYADKGILLVPIVFKPCDFNRWEDLGKLQFFKPNGSSYGKAEIENFTYADLINFKHTDGTLIPNPNIDRYILDLVKKVEDSFNNFLSQKEIKEVFIPQMALNSNFNKLSDYPKPSILFTGRKKEIEEFQKAFDFFRIFAIEGLGGTGKTQFMAQIIETTLFDSEKIIWLDGSSQSKFDVFVENAGYGDALKGENKTNLALYSGLKDLIEKDERVIFWDNYNDYEDSAFSEFLSFAYQYLKKSTIILITKIEPSIERISNLHIIKLEGLNKDALEYAKKLKTSNTRYNSIIDSDLEIICNGVEGHPLAIEFSMWLMSRGKSADDILCHMPEISGSRKVEEFSKRLFLDIFNHSKTTNAERECFLKCSVFKERISGEEINYLYDNEDVFYLLDGLMEKLLITFKNGFYEIHPLVRSFSYEKLLNKHYVHKKVANYFIEKRSNILNVSLEEKIFYHLVEAGEWEVIGDFIEIYGRELILLGQLGLLSELLNKLENKDICRPIFNVLNGDIAQIKGEWDSAMLYFEKASKNTEDNIIKAEGIIKYGEIIYRKGNAKESMIYFERAYEFSKKHFLQKEEARSLNDIGLVHFNFDNLDLAFEKFSSALKIRISINDTIGILASNNNIATIYINKSQFKKALEIHNQNIEIAENIGDRIGLGLYLMNSGNALRRLNRMPEALDKVNLALKISKEIGDKEIFSACLNTIGLIFIEQGKSEEGLLKYMEALQVRKEIGDKRGILSSFNNIGAFYLENNLNLDTALEYLFKSFSITKQIGAKASEKTTFNWINLMSTKIGKDKFKELAVKVYSKLESEEKEHILLKEFINEPKIRDAPKVGNNNLCPCGSGKKYKKCCRLN